MQRKLGGQPFQVLAILLERPGDLVTREELHKRLWRDDTFVDFEHSLNAIVNRLREVLDDSSDSPRFIETVPRRGYRFIAPVADARRRVVAWAAAGFLVLAAAAAATLWRLRWPELPPPTVVKLSSERFAGSGSFSPDGTQIAYGSAGEDGVNWDIWLKIVGEPGARRLTTDPAPETDPSWSPDGTQIAFRRLVSGSARSRASPTTGARAAGIYLVSPLGGPARQLSDFPAWSQASWSPDGRWLATSKGRSGGDPPGGIYLISVASGEPRAVTSPKVPSFDVNPAFSPDGRALAYAACEGAEQWPACEVSVLTLDAELRPQGTARHLTRQRLVNFGAAWTRDGRSIVYGSFPRLWRVRSDGGAPPERVELAGGARFPSTVNSRDRLAFVRWVADTDIYGLRLGGSPTPLIGSTFDERHPQYSPDGRRIAFESDRADDRLEIWLADADGSKPTRLTRGPGLSQGTPGWSPDARSIVFDSMAENGHRAVWTIGVDGSGLRQVTHDPADDIVPIWSRDGRFIYFTSNRTGRNEIWRAAAGGGAEVQLTHEGGDFPIESVDGRTLYYQRSLGASALLALPTAGGEERTILPCVPTWSYAVAPRGIFHMACDTPDAAVPRESSLRYWDAATGQDRLVAALETDPFGGLSVSPDGQSILYGSQKDASDLMMIENFR